MHKCSTCQQLLPLDQFHKNKASRKGHSYECKPCCKSRSKRRWQEMENKAEYCRRNVLRQYGITPAEYNRMFLAQDGLCAICSRPEEGSKNLSVDHDHVTGVVRGLLCAKCNQGIGLLREDPAIMRGAIQYITTRFKNGMP